jgi:hypothetical protein
MKIKIKIDQKEIETELLETHDAKCCGTCKHGYLEEYSDCIYCNKGVRFEKWTNKVTGETHEHYTSCMRSHNICGHFEKY